jgi:hypothetical protein
LPVIKINVDFKIGQTVFLKTDPEQFERLVTAIVVENKDISYQLSCGEDQSIHSDYEISAEKDELKRLGVEVNTDR